MSSEAGISTIVTLGVGFLTVIILYGIYHYQATNENRLQIQKDRKENVKTDDNDKNIREIKEEKQTDPVTPIKNNRKKEEVESKANEAQKIPKLSKLTSIANLASSFKEEELLKLPIDSKEYISILSNWYRNNSSLKRYLSKEIVNIILEYTKCKTKMFNLYNPFIVDVDIENNTQRIKNTDYKTKKIGGCTVLMITNKTIKELGPVTKIQFNINDVELKWMRCKVGFVSTFDRNFCANNEYKRSILYDNKWKHIGYYELDIHESYGNYAFYTQKHERYYGRLKNGGTEPCPLDKHFLMTIKCDKCYSGDTIAFYVDGKKIGMYKGDLMSYYQYHYFIEFASATSNFDISVINGSGDDVKS